MLTFQIHIDVSDSTISRVLTDALMALSPDCIASQGDDADVILSNKGQNEGVTPTYVMDTSKPLRMAHIIKGLNVAVKQHRPDITLGEAILSPSNNALTSDGQDIALTDLEVRVLSYLSAQPALTASKDDLLTHVWGYNPDVTSHTVETHIYRLRQKHEVLEGLIRTTDQGYMLYYNEGDNSGA